MALPDTEATHPSPPLAGLRILDLTQYLPGPWATWQLARLGAHVTKIEQPAGDPARHMGARQGDSSHVFVALHHGKDMLTLDLKQADGRDRFLGMVEQADAVLEGFRPGVMARLGLDWPTLQARNPRLVLCSLTAFGQEGPCARRAGHDINLLALTGVLSQIAARDGQPALCGLPIGDLFGGSQPALVALLAALLAVHRTGMGRWIDISMAHAMLESNFLAAATVDANRRDERGGQGMLTGGLPCYGIYATADHRHVAVGALEPKHWVALCDLLNRPDLARCHWSHGQVPGGEEARAVRDELDTIFAQHTLAHWTSRFDTADCCATPVLRTDEAMRHPQFAG